MLGESLRDEKGQQDGGISMELDGGSIALDLTPGLGLIRTSTRVAAIEFLRSRDDHRARSTVSEEGSVEDVMLGNTSTENELTNMLGRKSEHIQLTSIRDDIDNEALTLEGEHGEHISNGTVSNGRAEDRDVVLVGPVVDRVLIVDFLTETINKGGRSPDRLVVLLLLPHGLKDGHDPSLEVHIVVVGDQEVSNAVHTLETKLATIKIEVAHVVMAEALHEILLNTSSSSDDSINHVVLDEILDGLASTGAHQVGSVAKHDSSSRLRSETG